MFRQQSLILGIAIVAGTLPIRSFADIRLPVDRVVPVTFDQEINVSKAHIGDHFTATVVDELDMPHNAKFEGEVLDVRQQHGEKPAFVDMEFRSLILPDGSHYDVRAVPIHLDAKYVHRDSDGHFVVNKKPVRKDNVVFGGAVGGFILGSILKKPFEGTFLGILAGIVANETGATDQSNGVAVKRGEKLGALVEREVVIPDHHGPVAADRAAGPPPDGRRPEREPRFAGEIKIALGDHPLQFDPKETPYREGNTVMVPLMSTASQLKIDVDVASGGRVYVQEKDSILRLEQDSDHYRLNGKSGSLSSKVVSKQGVMFVPLEAFAALKQDPIYLNGVKIEFHT